MRLILGMVLFLSLIIIGLYIPLAFKESHKLASIVRKILFAGFLIVLFNLQINYSTKEDFCLFAYTCYFVLTDWLLYYLLQFSVEFSGSSFDVYVKRKLMLLLLLVDSASLLLNNYFHHLFCVEKASIFKDEIFFALSVKPPFYVHYFFILMLCLFCLVSLFYRAFHAPIFYRKKYALIAVIMVIVIALNICFYQSPIDFSVIGYVVEAVCIYYCTFVYTPKKLLSKALFQVTENMGLYLMILDYEGKIIYKNDAMKNILESKDPLLDNTGTHLKQWCYEQYIHKSNEFTCKHTFYRLDEEIILEIHMLKLSDTKKALQGGYFIIRDCTEEISEQKQQLYLSTHDALTGLYNRQHFFDVAQEWLDANPDTDFLMICTDINDFKMINDLFNSNIGDIILIHFANKIKNFLGKKAVYGRIENDIFGIMMPSRDYKEEKLMALLKSLSDLCITSESSYPLLCYAGVYDIVDRTCSISVMCDRARRAVASIKGEYHTQIAHYNENVRNIILHEQSILSELETALYEEQFKMYLQPQVNANGELLGAEALVRWQHPVKGMIFPGDFIPVLEEKGVISYLDKYIWEQACKKLQQWKKEGKKDLYISVNISPKDFYFLNIDQIFTDLIRKYDIAPENLKLEITETAIIKDLDRQLTLIEKLRSKGFVIEMDDFGSGYSSLNMLRDICVDILKLDMVFLRECKNEDRNNKILNMIIHLSKQLGMPVVAEGVETAEQLSSLAEMGCDIFQGYYFAKPMSVEQFEEYYELTKH